MTLPLTGVFGAIGPLGWPEILIILFVVMLLFGAKRLPDLAKGFGKSIKEFKKAANEVETEMNAEDPPADAPKNGADKAAKKAESKTGD